MDDRETKRKWTTHTQSDTKTVHDFIEWKSQRMKIIGQSLQFNFNDDNHFNIFYL